MPHLTASPPFKRTIHAQHEKRREHWFARAWAALREEPRAASLPVIEEYEQRLMYSADLAPHALLFNPTQPVEQRIIDTQGDFVAARTPLVELLIVDAAVSDRETLLSQLTADGRTIEIITLDTHRDGISQISAALAGRNDIATLHILSHGASGEIQLGNTLLDAGQLTARSIEIAQWANALTTSADILLYGCDVAADARGEAFVQQLSAVTRADVAASSDLTGNAKRGADWNLEFAFGQIESSIAFRNDARDAWSNTLATFTVTSQSGTGKGTINEAISKANANAGADTIVFNVGGGGVQILNISGALTITGPVTIDGTINSGASANGGAPAIILDGDGNSFAGLTLADGSDGSTMRGLIIRNFTGDGILIQKGADNNTIAGNYIGSLKEDGSRSGGGDVNSGVGIRVLSATNTIGGATVADRNIIGGNNSHGIQIDGAASSNNIITGNFIGTESDGTTALGNLGHGILIGNLAGNLTTNPVSNVAVIGGTNPGEGNTIAFNGGDGVYVPASNTIQILQNSIYANAGLGIDLGADGVTPNDAGDIDSGANNLQNFPLLTSATVASATQITVAGTLNSTSVTSFAIEFFSNTAPDPSGNGEGRTFLGFAITFTDFSGNASFSAPLTVTNPAGSQISATAIRLVPSFPTFFTTDTSEFSNIVIANNTAPVLNAGKAPVLAAVNEDAAAPAGAVGALVSSLVDLASVAGGLNNVTDPDTGALVGIAVTAADTANGSWFYSIDSGTNWNPLGLVADTSARLLAANGSTRVYFQPNANFNGSLPGAITFRAWDQTSGVNGGMADTSTSGGLTAFSTVVDTAALLVNPVNDAPTNTVPATQATPEDTPLVFSTLAGNAISINDIDTITAPLQMTLTSAGGTATLSGVAGLTFNSGSNGSAAMTFTGMQADINAALNGLSLTPSLNNNGAAAASLTLLTNDLGNTGTGGALTRTDTITINITPVNDAPVLDLNGAAAGVSAILAYTENAVAAVIAPAATVTDIDSANFNGGSLTAAFTGNGTATDQLTVRNQGTGAGQIGVSGANVSFGGTVIGVIDTVANGVNGSNLLVTFNNNAATPGAAQALIRNILYSNSSNNPSILPRTVTYTLNDGDGAASSTAVTATVNVTAVNDAPVLDLNGAGAGTSATMSYTENDVQTTIAPAATVMDEDAANFNGGKLTVAFTANGATEDQLAIQNQGTGAGQIGVSGSNISFGGVAIGTFTGGSNGNKLVVTFNSSATPVAAQALVEGIQYANTSDNPSTLARTLDYTLNDGGGTANGGANIAIATATITVTAVNDTPTATNLNTGETYTKNNKLNLINIVVTDPDGPTTIAKLTLSDLTAGSLTTSTKGGVTSTYNPGTGVWTASGAITQVNQLLAAVEFIPTTNFTGAFTIATSISDGVAAAVTGVKSMSGGLVNFPPTATNLAAAETYSEDTPLDLMDIVISDTDSPNVTATLTLTNLLAGMLTTATAGTVTSGFDPLTGSWSATGAIADVNTLLAGVMFTPTLNFNGNFNIATTVSDGIAAELNGTKIVTGTAVNDAPVLTLPAAAQSLNEDTTLNFSSGNGNLISVSDVDAGSGPLLITLSVTNGVLTLSGTGGLTPVSGGSGTNAMQYTGTLTDINAALDGMTYAPITDFNGGAGMGIVIGDQGNTGAGVPVPLSDAKGLGITVSAVNDAPVATIPPGPYTATEQASFNLRDMGLIVADVDAGTGIVEVTVSVVSGTLGASAGTTGVSISGSGSSLTFSGNVLQINDLLATTKGSTFTYINNSDTPPASDTLTLTINDKGNSGGGELTALTSQVINVTAVNDAPIPTITQAGYSTTEQTALNLYATGLFVADPDALGQIVEVTLSVGEGTLFVTAGGSLATVSNSGTNLVTVSGTIAQINALLNTDLTSTITYINNSDTPGNSTVFTLRIDDLGNTGTGGGRDAATSVAIAITPVNDAPAATIAAASYSATEQISLDLHGTGLAISDVDAGSGIVTVTVSVVSGVLTANTGTTGVTVGGSGSSLMLSGNILQINNVLSGNAGSTLAYLNNSDAPPASDTLTLHINDEGNTGGGDLFAQSQVTINITPVNDAPVATAPAGYSATEQIAIDLKNTGLSVGDLDSGANLVTVTLSVSEGILTVTPGTSGVTLVLGSGLGNVLILGTAASINSLLNSDAGSVVNYINNSNTPSASITLTLDINDNGASGVGGGFNSTANSAITVAAVNDAPVAIADTLAATEDTPVIYTAASLLGNDTDVDGPALTIAGVTSGAGGSAVLNGDGTVTFTPGADFNGTASFSYVASDGALPSNSAAVSVTVAAVNDAPVANTDTLAAIEDTPIIYTAAQLLGNDTDVDGPALTIAGVTSGAGGSAVLNGDGTVTFTPGADFNGTASFSYVASDGALPSNSAAVSVTVAAVNDAPVANTDTLAAIEDTPIIYTAAQLLGNDTDVDGPALTIAGVTSGAGGSAVLNGDGTVTFTPGADFNGTASFSYVASDGALPSNSATVTVNVAAVNDAPVANTDTLAATEDTLIIYTAAQLLGNDTDVDGPALAIANVTSGAGGSVVLNGDGTVTFTPGADFNGAASFSYVASDGALPSNSAAVSVTVAAVNDAPVAIAPANYLATEQVALDLKNTGLSVSDADAGVGSVTATLSVATGVINVAAGGSGATVTNSGTSSVTIAGNSNQINSLLNTDAASAVNYTNASDTPAANTTLTLAINDNGNSGGSALSNSANALINLIAINDAPVATAPASYTATEQTALNLKNSGLSIADVDAGGANVTVTLSAGEGAISVTAGSSGVTSVTGSGSDTVVITGAVANINQLLNTDGSSTVSYINPSDEPSSSTPFKLTINDNGNSGAGGGLSNTSTATLKITAVNDAPAITVPGVAYSATEQIAFDLKNTGLTVTDTDAGAATVTLTLSVAQGVLNATAGTSGAFIAGTGTSMLTVTGNINNINNLLNTDGSSTLTYFNNNNAPALSTTLSLSLNDGGNSGSGGALVASRNVAINITAVNDPPVTTPVTLTAIAEDSGPRLITQADLLANASDPDGPLPTAVNLNLSSGAGTLVDNLNGTWRYVPALDDDTAASFTYAITDGTLAVAASATLDITPVNDAPSATNLNTGETYAMNSPQNLVDIVVSDVDGPSVTALLTLSDPGAGSLNVATSGATTSTYVSASGVWTASGSVTDVNALLMGLTFTPTLNFTGNLTIATLVSDSVAPAVTGVKIVTGPLSNLPPGATNLNAAEVYIEDNLLILNNIFVSDADSPTVSVLLTLSNPAAGSLSVASVGALTSTFNTLSGVWAASGAIADVNALLAGVTFNPAADFNGSFTIATSVSDGVAAPVSGVKIVIGTPVNDAPLNTAPAAQTIGEDTALTFTLANTISIADVDGSVATTQLTVGKGTLSVTLAGAAAISAGANNSSALTLSGTLVDINATLAGLKYLGDLNFNGADNLQIVSSDLGNTGAGGVLIDTDNVALTFNAVNDPPVITVPGAQTVNEDALLIFAGVNTIGVSDVDGGAVSTRLSVGNGTLNVTLAGATGISAGAANSADVTLTGTQAELNATLASLTYQGTLDFNGADTLQVFTSDLGNTGAGGVLTASRSVALTVNAINDAPVNATPAAQTADEDTALSFTGAAIISISDVDGSAATTQLTVGNGTLSVTLAGAAAISAGANNSSALTLSGTAADMNATLASLSYRGNLNFAGVDSLKIVTSDLGSSGTGGVLTDTDSVALTINAVNDAPFNTAPGALALNEDAVLSFTGANAISISDVDGVTASSQLSAANGTLNVTLAGSAVVSAGANNSGTLTITGSQADINATLGSLAYQGKLHFNGADSLQIITSDLGFTGTGGMLIDSDTVALTVAAVNDAPATLPVSLTAIAEDSGAHLITQAELLLNAGDVDGPALSAINLAITSGAGTLVDNGNGTWSYTPSLNDDTAVVFGYDVSDGSLNAAGSAGLDITPVNDAPTAASLSVTTQDTTAVIFHVSDFQYADTESNPLTKIRITALPASGKLDLNGSAVVVNQEIAATDIASGKLSFVPQQGNPVLTNTAFGFQVNDGTDYSAASYSVAVTVAPAPVAAPASTPPAVAVAQPDASAPVLTTAPSKTAPAAADVADTDNAAAKKLLAAAQNVEQGTVPVNLLDTTGTPQARAREGFAETPQQRLISAGSGGVSLTPFTLALNINPVRIDGLAAGDTSVAGRIATATASPAFTRELDRVRDSAKAAEEVERNIIVSSVTAGAGMSVGYVLWLLRGGLLLTSLLSSLPAWRFVDPLPVLGTLDKNDEEDDDGGGESIESMVSNENAAEDKRNA